MDRPERAGFGGLSDRGLRRLGVGLLEKELSDLGSALVDDLIREVVKLAIRERYPTDGGLAADAVRVLARVARKVQYELGFDAGPEKDP